MNSTDKLLNIHDSRKKRFSDFADEPKCLDGEKIKIDKILNKEIEVTGCKITNTKYPKNNSGKCLMMQITVEKETRVVFTGSDVLIDQMTKYVDEIPFVAVIKKIDKYYTLS
jgi:hypothetical protein